MKSGRSIYFKSCTTEEDVKKEYRRLAFKCHPDHGGSTIIFQEMIAQYEHSLNKINGTSYSSSEGRSNPYRKYETYTYSWTKTVKYSPGLKKTLRDFIRAHGAPQVRMYMAKKKGFWLRPTQIVIKFESENKHLLELVLKLALMTNIVKPI